MKNSDQLWDIVDGKRMAYVALADRVFETPEIAYTEARSAAAHREQLVAEGARVTERLAGIPTAVMGEWGEGGPVIAILGEYDALPGLGQEPGVAEERPLGRFGHGCGHNLLGSAALMAAASLAGWLKETGRKGRVRYYGCPAEEGGAAKTFMVREELFADVDAAITWHPGDYTGVVGGGFLANMASPELGRSALDAVELMNVGINYMREHMPSDARVHYAYLDAGGEAPNVVQAKATVRQLVRARTNRELLALVERVRKIGEGAALMTETRVEAKVASAVSNVLGNGPLEEAMEAEMERLGPPVFDEADRAFAREIQATLTPAHLADAFRRTGRRPVADQPLADFVVPLAQSGDKAQGSTDVGDVSWAVPTVQAWVTTCAFGTPFHSWQLTAQGKSPAAHKGMVHAAKVMAATGRRLFEDAGLLARAKAEHTRALAAEPYVCPLPPEVAPPIPMAAE